MANIVFPITKIDIGRFSVVVDLTLYAKETIIASLYKYTDRFYIHQKSSGNTVNVIFESKGGSEVSEEVVKNFCNELIDQQVRYNINLQFGHIRDLIVEEAFKPIAI